MAGKSASSSWLPGGQSAASAAGLGDNDVQKTVTDAVATAQSGGSVSDYAQQRKQELARRQGQAAQAAQQDATEEWVASLRAQQAAQRQQAQQAVATVNDLHAGEDTRSQQTGGSGSGSTPTIIKPSQQQNPYGSIAAYTDTGGNGGSVHYDPTVSGNGTPRSPTDPVNPVTTNSGSGNGGGSAAAPAAEADTTPVASPSDYYAEAGQTTQRITNGVDLTEAINAVDNAWAQATQGYVQNAEGILQTLQNTTEQDLANYAASTGQTIAQATQQINDIIAGLQAQLGPADAGRVGRVDTVEEENLLNQIVQAQKEQSKNQINYAVNQGANDLQRAEEDAQAQFQTQRDQIAAQERQALDNQALYSEMRGDRGGVGQAQYGTIQNNAATNQLTVNKEQTKLATDTARQIADLRAKGEFQKADELLSITQSYLSQLMQLKQWADETNVSIDEFNIGVEQWEQEYNAKIQQALGELGINAVQYSTGLDLSRQQDLQSQRQNLTDTLAQYQLANNQYATESDVNRLSGILSARQQNANNMASTELAAANITGAFSDATPTQDARARVQSQLASAGEAMISAGLTPSDDQLAAMGWTKPQYNAYKDALAAAKKRGAGSGASNKLLQLMRDMVETGTPLADIKDALDYAVRSGNYSAADNAASTDFVTQQEQTGYTGRT